jgi:hypothetical protein
MPAFASIRYSRPDSSYRINSTTFAALNEELMQISCNLSCSDLPAVFGLAVLRQIDILTSLPIEEAREFILQCATRSK